MKRLVAGLVLGLALVGLGPTQSALAADTNGTPALAASDTYGAIAYAPSTQQWGYSSNYGSREVATSAALGYCASTGATDCQLAVWYRNAWGALAIASNGAWGSSWDELQNRAEDNAWNVCYNYGGADCTVQLSVHS